MARPRALDVRGSLGVRLSKGNIGEQVRAARVLLDWSLVSQSPAIGPP